MKYQDGEKVTYVCESDIYKFPLEKVEKSNWQPTFDVECGWANQWNPPIVTGCVDPRGCQAPPNRTSRVWGSYEDTYGSTDVGMMYWYECRKGVFEFPNGTRQGSIDLVCVNDPFGGSPYWIPPYDHDANPFPPCVILRKYAV